jgi:hypothetical protein
MDSAMNNDYDYDPIEDDPKLGPIIRKAEKQAESELTAFKGESGFCHMLWSRQQKILKEQYGIDWKSPQDMTQGINSDR